MGSLTLPISGTIYLDANGFIYTVEKIEPYRSDLVTLWQAVQSGTLKVVSSELTLMEVLVKPLRDQSLAIERAFRSVLQGSPDVRLLTITIAVLERAANLRASTGLKTPDAIHAATALEHGCALFITNDPAFRRVPGLTVTVLDDLISP